MKAKSEIITVKTQIIALYIIAFSIAAVFVVYIGITVMSFYGTKPLEPNVIGDTLGGTLSPIIGLVSAILIYITIGQQIEANRLIQEQFKKLERAKFEEIIYDKVALGLKEIEREIRDFAFISKDRAIIEWDSNSLKVPVDILNMLDYKIFLNNAAKFIVVNKSNELEANLREDNPKRVFEIFLKFTEIIDFFARNVEMETAYLFIVKKDLDNISEKFYTPCIGVLEHGASNLFPLFHYESSDDLKVLRRYYKAKNTIYKKLGEQEMIATTENVISILDMVLKDLDTYLKFKLEALIAKIDLTICSVYDEEDYTSEQKKLIDEFNNFKSSVEPNESYAI